jgi:hypothetical protein
MRDVADKAMTGIAGWGYGAFCAALKMRDRMSVAGRR